MDYDESAVDPLAGSDSKAAYAREVQELSSDEEERGPVLRTAASRPIDSEFAAARHFAAPASAFSAASGATAAAADVDMAASDADEQEESDEYESDADDDEDDDDELGGNEGDRRFQAMLEQMQSAGGAGGGAEGDLLSQILKGGSSAWRGSNRTRDVGEEGDDEEKKSGDAAGAAQSADSSSSGSTGTMGSVGEDAVDYQIYCDTMLTTPSAPADAAAAQVRLAALRTAVLEFLTPVTADHIWQREGLQLAVCTPHVHSAAGSGSLGGSTGSAGAAAAPARSSRSVFSSAHASAHSTLLPHLHGSTYFGDNIEDEWLIVYMLLTLSSHYPSLSVALSDADGSFLCIELADTLPQWLRPENSAHRVWLRRGQVHIIPVPQSPAQLATVPARPSIEQALNLLHSQAVPTAAGSDAQRALLSKLSPFFAASTTPSFALSSPSLSSSHHARVALPLPLALLLARYPQLMAEWAGSFFLRDAVDMKRANKMERVLGLSRRAHVPAPATAAAVEEEGKMTDSDAAAAAVPAAPAAAGSAGTVPFVFMRARFTHCLYAQLSHQRFSAPRTFSRHLSALTSSMGPAATGPLVARAVDLGAKIATGAEMWFGNQKAELARRTSKARLARQKIAAAAAAPNADVARRDEAARVATLLRREGGASLRSAGEVEAFFATAASAPGLVEPWRLFLASLDSLGMPALASVSHGAPPESLRADPRFWGGLVSAYLYAHFQPHRCVDQERVDELLHDPALLPLFAAGAGAGQEGQAGEGQERRVESCINLPYEARVLELMDQLCDACLAPSTATAGAAATTTAAAAGDPATAAVSSLPSSWRSAASALLRATFSSLPRDDSEDWLTLTPAQLESMLSKATAAAAAAGSGSGAGSGAAADGQMDRGGGGEYDGVAIVQSMHRFVGKLSEVEGVVAPKAATTTAATKTKATPAAPDAATAAAAKPASNKGKGVSFAPDTKAANSKPKAPAFQPLSVDSNELMRLLSSVDVNAAQFAFAPPQGPGQGHGSFNRAIGGGGKGASDLPASDSEGEEEDDDSGDEDVLWGPDKPAAAAAAAAGARSRHPALADSDSEDEILDPRQRPPTKKTTRPPENDAYAAAFGPDAGKSGASVTPADLASLAQPSVLQPSSSQAAAASVSAPGAPVTSSVSAAQPSAASSKPSSASKAASSKPATKPSPKPQLRDYMDAMDAELQQAGLQSDFVREEDAAALAAGSTAAPPSSSSSSRGPVNVDVNLLTNLLRSHEGESAQGWTHAGPVSSIMGSMGMHLPAPDRDEKEHDSHASTSQ